MSRFASAVIRWQQRYGRRDLPWQGARDPYRVWLSEVMLQQTQVGAVIPYYQRFVARFPNVQALAAARRHEVLRLWSGLGYYARGRNLHAAAKIIARDGFPRAAAELEKLPGVGRSTAAAIAAFAFGERAAILDGNVKRVLARYFGIEGWPGHAEVERKLWDRAEEVLPRRDMATYTQGLMDLGATVCTRLSPRCGACPVQRSCEVRKAGRTDIPSARPRKVLPQKSATWRVFRHGEELMLEQRPSNGLWGGLWAFPEKDIPAPVRLIAVRPLSERVHGFTHFQLRIAPVLYSVAEKPASMQGMRWRKVRAWLGAAIPAPVRQVLEELVVLDE